MRTPQPLVFADDAILPQKSDDKMPRKLNLDDIATPQKRSEPVVPSSPVKPLNLDAFSSPKPKPSNDTASLAETKITRPLVLPDTPSKPVPKPTPSPHSLFTTAVVIDANMTPEQKIAMRAKTGIVLTDKMCSINYASAEVKALTSIDDTLVQMTNVNPSSQIKRQLQLILTIITMDTAPVGAISKLFKRFTSDDNTNMSDLVTRVNAVCTTVEQHITDMGDFVKKLTTVADTVGDAHKALQVYIDVGAAELQNNGVLTKKLLAPDLSSANTMVLQTALEKCAAIDSFDKRISYLRQIVQMSQMTVQQIKLMQDTSFRLMTQTRAVLEQTVPQWKKQFISVYVSNAAKGLKAVSDSEKAVLQSIEEQLKAEIQQVIS